MSQPLSRRTVLSGAAGLAGGLATPVTAQSARAATLIRSGGPTITHGIQSGDVSGGSAVIWARADRAARMYVQLSPTGRFDRPERTRTLRGPLLEVGARQVFAAAPPRANTSPLEGFQFFGEVGIDGHTRDLTVTLRDLTGAALWAKTLPHS